MDAEYQKRSSDEQPNPQPDYEAQQAARKAVMAIPLFPDLDRELNKALGFGPHCKMLQHFCYWMHPRKPKMQNRWTLWKTFAEWHDECGLTERQVKKGRRVLAEKGLATYKRGQYSRIYYRVDWAALAEVLCLDFIPDGNSVQYDDELNDETDLLDDSIPDGNTVRLHSRRYSVPFIPDGNTVRLNTEDYTEDYLTEDTLLHSGGEPAKAEPPPQQKNGKKEEKVEIPPPAKPHNDALLAEVKEILNAKSGRWHHAELIAKNHAKNTAEKIAGYIVMNAEDIKRPEAATSAPREELVQAVGYVLWDREEHNG
jgi:hypothetical protein